MFLCLVNYKGHLWSFLEQLEIQQQKSTSCLCPKLLEGILWIRCSGRERDRERVIHVSAILCSIAHFSIGIYSLHFRRSLKNFWFRQATPFTSFKLHVQTHCELLGCKLYKVHSTLVHSAPYTLHMLQSTQIMWIWCNDPYVHDNLYLVWKWSLILVLVPESASFGVPKIWKWHSFHKILCTKLCSHSSRTPSANWTMHSCTIFSWGRLAWVQVTILAMLQCCTTPAESWQD